VALIGSGTLGGDQPPKAPDRGGNSMKRYEVEINGIPTTLQLSDEEAKARGLSGGTEEGAKAKARAAVPNKARTAEDKRADVADKSFAKKAPAKKTTR